MRVVEETARQIPKVAPKTSKTVTTGAAKGRKTTKATSDKTEKTIKKEAAHARTKATNLKTKATTHLARQKRSNLQAGKKSARKGKLVVLFC